MKKDKALSKIYLNTDSILLKAPHEYLRIQINRIAYCEADGSYSKIVLVDGPKVMTSKSLGVLSKYLTQKFFIRCHNSYLINCEKVEKFDNRHNVLIVSGQKVPVSRRKRSQIMRQLRILNYQI